MRGSSSTFEARGRDGVKSVWSNSNGDNDFEAGHRGG